MDTFCAICQDDMTQVTGHATLSCGHSFHLCCIVNALCYQVGLPSSCPLCRLHVTDLSDIWWMREEQAGSVPEPQPLPASTWRRRSETEWYRPGVLNPEEEDEKGVPILWAHESEYPPPESLVDQVTAAATKFQAAWRGHWVRRWLLADA